MHLLFTICVPNLTYAADVKDLLASNLSKYNTALNNAIRKIQLSTLITKLKGPLNFFVIGEFRYSQLWFNVQCYYENCFLKIAANIRIVVETVYY